MLKNIDIAKKDALSKTSTLFSLALNQNFVKNMLEENWDTYLSVSTNMDFFLYQNQKKSFFLQIPLPCDYNYLFLAKVFNVLCHSYNLKYIIRQLAKQEFTDVELGKCLSNKFISKSVFLRWLLRLWIAKFSKYIQCYTVYLSKCPWILDVHKIRMKYFKNKKYFILENTDFLFLKYYKIRTQMLYAYSISIDKYKNNDIHHPCISINNTDSGLSFLNHNMKFGLNKKKNDSNILLFSNSLFRSKSKLNIVAQKKYMNLIKQVVQCNKSNIQVDIIKKINQIIKLWDRSYNFFLDKKNCINLNHLLLEALWHWAIVRHARKPAQWIKKRYWCTIYDGFYFYGI